MEKSCWYQDLNLQSSSIKSYLYCIRSFLEGFGLFKWLVREGPFLRYHQHITNTSLKRKKMCQGHLKLPLSWSNTATPSYPHLFRTRVRAIVGLVGRKKPRWTTFANLKSKVEVWENSHTSLLYQLTTTCSSSNQTHLPQGKVCISGSAKTLKLLGKSQDQ